MSFNHPLKISLGILFLLFAFHLKAQQIPVKAKGKITGKIIDSITGKPVDYATISLAQGGNDGKDKMVNGTTTDESGSFVLNDIAEGNYKLFIYFIGYQTVVKSIVISKTNSTVSFKVIKLVSKQTQLKEVTISTQKSLIENKIDKIVYNAEQDLTSQGGVATDMLKKVPQVSVDVNGNVELQGNANIRFLINGKPSTMFGNNLADVLQSIPASQIQSIEVITSPGAKYDAEGTGGIINIILKKTTAQGINGNVSLSAGTRLENGSFNLSARKGNFGVNAFLSGNGMLTSTTLNAMDRTSQDASSNQTSRLIQNGNSDFYRLGYQTGLNMDWELNKKNNITASFSYNSYANSGIGATTRQSLLQDVNGNTLSNVYNSIDANNRFHFQTYDWSISYKKTFAKEDQELDILYNASYGINSSYYQQIQKDSSNTAYSGSNANNPGTDRQTNISINYTHPLSKAVILETGAKTVLSQVITSTDVSLFNPSNSEFVYNAQQSNALNYNRYIYAAYISATFKLKYFDLRVGCRDEYTETKADFPNVSINPYNSVVPSGLISHTFKGNQTLKLSYTHRIQRPDYRDLNPFYNLSDPKNIFTGNPGLAPEIADNIELGYNKSFEKGANIYVAIFSRRSNYDIQPYTVYYPSLSIGDSVYKNVSVSTRQNIGLENNYGMNVYISIPATSKISLRSNLAAFQRYITNTIDPGYNVSGFNYRVNLNVSYQVTSTLVMEAFGNFNSPRVGVQGTMPSFTTYNFAFRKLFFHKKASFAFTTTNPFNEYVDQKTVLNGQNFRMTSLRQLPYRSFGINITYKFGKLEFKKEKNQEEPEPPMPGN
ncbi:MAG: TonB-dependent receptor domain-containing protein [Bacteroidia bacterium]